jgi:hypothetical protein
MTKVFLQPGLRGLSGGMGDWVYQIRRGKTVVGMKPMNTKERTEMQLAQQERFSKAAVYAKKALANPAKREFYEMVAKEKDIAPYLVAVTDYLSVPSIKPLDLSDYSGQVGDPILVQVLDDCGLVSVEVELIGIDETIEQGSAVETEPRSGVWIYTAQTPIPTGVNISIRVTGLDHTGKKVQTTEFPVVGAQA